MCLSGTLLIHVLAFLKFMHAHKILSLLDLDFIACPFVISSLSTLQHHQLWF